MIIKKMAIVISAVVLMLSACGADNELHRYDTASGFLPIEEVSGFLGYTPVIEEKTTRLEKRAVYKSEVSGAGDIVRLSIYPPNQKYSASDIKAQFNMEREKNEKYKTLIEAEGLDADAFISIPSIHVCKNGHYAVITAGSGGGDEQIKLLKELANIVIYNLDKQEPVLDAIESADE